MVSILDLPEVRERVSVADYHKMDEFNVNRIRTELIRGIVLEKPSPNHADKSAPPQSGDKSPLSKALRAPASKVMGNRQPAGRGRLRGNRFEE